MSHNSISQVEALEDEGSFHSSPNPVLHEGSHFGQKNMICNLPWDVSYKAKTHCDIFSLSSDDYNEVVESHPKIKDQIAEMAKEMFDLPINKN